MAEICIKEEKLPHARAAFFNAFLTALETTDYANISISDLVNSSGFSRSSFYVNFENKEDLVEKLVSWNASQFVLSTYGTYKDQYSSITNNLYIPMSALFQHAYGSRKFYHLLFGNKIPGHDLISYQILTSEYIKRNMKVTMETSDSNLNYDMFWFIGNLKPLGFIVFWDLNNFKYSPEYMAQNAAKIMPPINGVKRIGSSFIEIQSSPHTDS